MNVSYTGQDLGSDRAKINAIKKDPNPFRNKICALLNANNQQGSYFIGELHDLLENHYIYNQDKRISFTCIIIGKNPTNLSTYSYRGITYRVQYGNGVPGNTQTEVLIKNHAGDAIVHITQPDYDIDGLKAHQKFIAKKKKTIKLLYTSRTIYCQRFHNWI